MLTRSLRGMGNWFQHTLTIFRVHGILIYRIEVFNMMRIIWSSVLLKNFFGISVSYCCITNHPNMQGLKTITYLTHNSVKKQFRQDSSGWFFLSQLGSLINYGQVQVGFAGLFCTLSHVSVTGWDHWVDSALDHVLSSSSGSASNCSYGSWEGCKGSCRLGFELVQCQFCWTLRTEASHKAY